MTVRILVKGKVQGVFFRASTKAKARELNLKGYVQNLEDGSVYIEARGEKENISSLIEWCKTGPSAAQVEFCDWQEIEPKDYSEFLIK